MTTAMTAFVAMGADQARSYVSAINASMNSARSMLLELYEREGWKALGYASWRECVVAEFQQSQAYLYRQLDAARVERAISPMGEISEQLPERRLREIASVPQERRREIVEVARTLPFKDLAAASRALRVEVNQRRELERPADAPKPATPIDPVQLDPRDRFDVTDAAALSSVWPSGAVDLIVTSPPYAVDKPYLGGDVPTYRDWLVAMGDWMQALYAIANPEHGRLCLNIPLDRDLGGWQPVAADALAIARANDWLYRTWIMWEDGQAGAGTDRGSVDSASAPNVTAPAEAVLVLYRGAWNWPGPKGTNHTDWLELCGPRGVWHFPGVRGDVLAPAPFPEEIPRRCISVFSHPGSIVADPFCGRGTTAGVAARMGRIAWAADRNAACVDAARAWVARERAVKTAVA